MSPQRDESGSAGLVLVLMTPFFIAMILLVVGLGRVVHARQLVDLAGAAGARAAALATTPGQAGTDARDAAGAALQQAGVTCQDLQVSTDTATFRPGGYVEVDVSCRSDLGDLALGGLPGSVLMASSSRSPLETYRDLS